jgi:hypothetical protein
MSDWYERNKERILAEKKLQYAQDKAFREAKKEQTLTNYYKKKAECANLGNIYLKKKRK